MSRQAPGAASPADGQVLLVPRHGDRRRQQDHQEPPAARQWHDRRAAPRRLPRLSWERVVECPAGRPGRRYLDHGARGGCSPDARWRDCVSRPVPCAECHLVPSSITTPGHTDSPRPAELTFSGVALSFSAQPSFDGTRCANTYCHGAKFYKGYPSGGTNTAPKWTGAGQGEVYCGSCHSLPPPAPHIQTTMPCSDCHANMQNGFGFIDPKKHIDGIVE